MRTRLAAAALLLASCSLVHQRAEERPVAGAPAAKGVLEYGVGRLSFRMPDRWEARGDDRKLRLSHPDATGRLDVEQSEARYRDEQGCLAAAQESLSRGAAGLTGVRRHASSFAGRKAIAQEADTNGWHGWAWAVCDGATQYRVFFAGRAPVAPDVVEAWKIFTRSAKVGGGR